MSQDAQGRFDVPLKALERSVHFPREEQTEEVPERERDRSAWAWDEERRQNRLAGGA
jgi:hypothetical protein